ncbi:NADP-dependent malic enzyme [Biscogniauxia marginata]|nr:NADP-dependent malic enzyme [Biscogniauxia marginata]
MLFETPTKPAYCTNPPCRCWMAKGRGLSTRNARAGVFGLAPRASAWLLFRSPPVIINRTGRLDIRHLIRLISSGSNKHNHLPEPCLSHPGLFSSSTTGSGIRKREPEPEPGPEPEPEPEPVPYSLSEPQLTTPAAIGLSTDTNSRPSPPTNSGGAIPRPDINCSFLLSHTPARPMAYNTYTTASSDISTPRSSSPSTFSTRSSQSSVSNKRLSLSLQRRTSSLNPMSTVDVTAIEQSMKMAALDGLRGYAQDHYGEVRQYRTTDYVPKSAAGGYQVLREPLWNKGLSFTPEERVSKNLTGLIPHAMESVETQVARCMKMINSRPTNIDKYLYLSSLKDQNFDLFYRVLIDNVRDLLPLVYTPTIGDVCLQYSTLYTRPEALYISIKQRKSIRTILRNWPYPNPEICVVTDGSRILGLGDLGVNGVGISIGKLSLYTGAAGIHPENTLPIVLDTGTNNEDNLKDPLYLGLRAKRPSPAVAQEFMDEFMEATADVFPNMFVQFEDFETEKAFAYLSRYRNKYKCFNDDIQGTGAVVLAGYIGAVNLSGVPLEDQRLVFMGAGSAGVGVAKQLVEYYTRRGLSEQAAREKFYLVDTKGLVTNDRGDKLPEHKKYFARSDNNGHQFRSLEEVIEYVRPSALVGLTATFGVFTESVVRALKASVDSGGAGRRPILFPLSNPLTKAECTFEQAVQWTEGTAIFASGSPFAPFAVKSGDHAVTYWPNQGNNVYVFPGLGLGAILAKASRVTDEMVYISAASLAESLNAEEIHKGLIYPNIERVRDASVVVAREVMKAARREGVSTLPDEQWVEWEEWGDVDLTKYIKDRVYDPLK